MSEGTVYVDKFWPEKGYDDDHEWNKITVLSTGGLEDIIMKEHSIKLFVCGKFISITFSKMMSDYETLDNLTFTAERYLIS